MQHSTHQKLANFHTCCGKTWRTANTHSTPRRRQDGRCGGYAGVHGSTIRRLARQHARPAALRASLPTFLPLFPSRNSMPRLTSGARTVRLLSPSLSHAAGVARQDAELDRRTRLPRRHTPLFHLLYHTAGCGLPSVSLTVLPRAHARVRHARAPARCVTVWRLSTCRRTHGFRGARIRGDASPLSGGRLRACRLDVLPAGRGRACSLSCNEVGGRSRL